MEARFDSGRENAPHSFYHACKAIDGLAADGTYHIVCMRVSAFYRLRVRQFYYEAVLSLAQLREIHSENLILSAARVPEWQAPHVALGLRLFRSAFSAAAGVLPMPSAGDDEVGDHSVAMIGWDEGADRILFQNSWGRDWGNDGCGAISTAYFDSCAIDVVVARNARFGPHPSKSGSFAAATELKAYVDTWLRPNRRRRFRQRVYGRRYQVCSYQTISLRGNPVMVVEVRNGYGLRLAWAFLEHYPEANDSITGYVSEFFVWPVFRRLGIAHLLERLLVDVARLWDAKRLRICIWQADFVDRNSAQRIASAFSANYELIDAPPPPRSAILAFLERPI
jgi:hypothetical protein